MQELARTSAGGTVYTAQQVSDVLMGPAAREDWRCYRLNATGALDISGYVDHNNPPSITFDATAAVMRTLRIPRIAGNVPLSPLSDILEMRYLLYMPDGTPVDWKLGRFTMTPGEKTIEPSGTYMALDGADYGQLLVDAPLLESIAVAAGSDVLSAVAAIVADYGGIPINIDIPSAGTKLPADLGWDAGTSRLKAINELLQAIAYEPAWFDETGSLRSSPLIDYSTVVPAFYFNTNLPKNIVRTQLRSRPVLGNAFNICRVIGEDARRELVSAEYVNDSPESDISTLNWHPKVKVIKDSKMTSDAACYARARSECQAAARVYAPLTVPTASWPLSQYRDVYDLTFTNQDEGTVSKAYVEEKWTHRCGAGQGTDHVLVQLVAA